MAALTIMEDILSPKLRISSRVFLGSTPSSLTPWHILSSLSASSSILRPVSSLAAGSVMHAEHISRCLFLSSESDSRQDSSPLSARRAVLTSRSVTPPRADTTTMAHSPRLSIIDFTLERLSGVPTELPPNFIIFISESCFRFCEPKIMD